MKGKKILATILSLAMVFGLSLSGSIPAMAADSDQNTEPTVISLGKNAKIARADNGVELTDPDRPTSWLTDGVKTTNEYVHTNATIEALGASRPFVYYQVDLGAVCDITGIAMWRYFADTRKYQNTILVVSEDDVFENEDDVVVYNANTITAGTYGTCATYYGAGEETPYSETAAGHEFTVPQELKGRYVRAYMRGSILPNGNHHWDEHVVELEVTGIEPPPVNPHDPENEISFGSDTLQVTLDKVYGIPTRYTVEESDTFLGDYKGNKLSAECYKNGYKTIQNISATSVDVTEGTAVAHFSATDGATACFNFDIEYAVKDGQLVISLKNVQEQNGYELRMVNMDALVSLRQGDGGSPWFVWGSDDSGNTGGTLVDLEQSKTGQKSRAATLLPVTIMGTDARVAAMENLGWINVTKVTVSGAGENKYESMGAGLTYRQMGSNMYLFNNQKQRPLTNPSVDPAVRIDFVGDKTNDGKVDWLDGANQIHENMPSKPSDYYDDALFYYVVGADVTDDAQIGGTGGGGYKINTTMEELQEIIAKTDHLTDGAKQVVPYAGLWREGWDSNYPNVNKDIFNTGLGGTYGDYMAMKGVMLQNHNANVTAFDNYDDWYPRNEGFDWDLIAKNSNGNYSQGWHVPTTDGSSGQGYNVSFKKYYESGKCTQRVNYTVDTYDVHGGMLIDILASLDYGRFDDNPDSPISGVENMYYKTKWLEEFNKLGVNIFTEKIGYGILGEVGYGAIMYQLTNPFVTNSLNEFGGTSVPLLSAIFRDKMYYDQQDGNGSITRANAFYHNVKMDLTKITADGSHRDTMNANNGGFYSEKRMTDLYYLYELPWEKVNPQEMISHSYDGTVHTITLENGYEMQVKANNGLTITKDGVQIAYSEGSLNQTTCPIDDQRIAFYSSQAKTLTYPLPEGANAGYLTARTLSADGAAPSQVSVENGMIQVSVEADTPVVVTLETAPEINKTFLKETIDEAEKDKKNYPANLIEAVKVRFEATLTHAWEVYNDENATQALVNAADAQLIKIMQYLSFTADPTGIQEAIDAAEALIASGKYEDDAAMTEYSNLLQAAKDVLAAEDSMTEDFDGAIAALVEGAKDLHEKAELDLELLQYYYDIAKDYDLSKYLDLGTTQADFTAARDAAKTLLDAPTNQDAIDAATTALHTAMRNLRLIPNKDALKELLDEANAKDLSLYTKSSGEALQAAIRVAKAVYDNPLAEQQAVDEANAILVKAIDGLQPAETGGEGDTPKTGDSTPIVLLGLFLAGAMCTIVLLRRRIKN